jgi:hypothetical protein
MGAFAVPFRSQRLNTDYEKGPVISRARHPDPSLLSLCNPDRSPLCGSSRPESAERRDPGVHLFAVCQWHLPSGEADAFHASGEGNPAYRSNSIAFLSHPKRSEGSRRALQRPSSATHLSKLPRRPIPKATRKRISPQNPKTPPILHYPEKISSICNTINKKINLTANSKSTSNITLLA